MSFGRVVPDQDPGQAPRDFDLIMGVAWAAVVASGSARLSLEPSSQRLPSGRWDTPCLWSTRQRSCDLGELRCALADLSLEEFPPKPLRGTKFETGRRYSGFAAVDRMGPLQVDRRGASTGSRRVRPEQGSSCTAGQTPMR